jgi:hypothetical protein
MTNELASNTAATRARCMPSMQMMAFALMAQHQALWIHRCTAMIQRLDVAADYNSNRVRSSLTTSYLVAR